MHSNYRPRRAGRKWLDGDCPTGVLAILDNGGATADRYTVIYSEPMIGRDGSTWLALRDMSSDPYHPQGIGIWSEYPAHVIAAYRNRHHHLYARWSDLPEPVQRCVRQDLEVPQ